MKEIEDLYILYKKDVYMYLLSLTRDPTLSEELLSETFVRAITAIDGFRGQSSVKTWLCTIGRNLWLQSLRKEKQTVEYNDLLQLYVTDNIVERVVKNETVARIKELLNEKDERTQMIVNMRVEGYSYAEIAEVVQMSESSARVIDFRTKKWLKTVLEKEGLR